MAAGQKPVKADWSMLTPMKAVKSQNQGETKKTSASDTLKKLDALDAQRRTIESTVKPEIPAQPSLAPLRF